MEQSILTTKQELLFRSLQEVTDEFNLQWVGDKLQLNTQVLTALESFSYNFACFTCSLRIYLHNSFFIDLKVETAGDRDYLLFV